MAYNTFETVDNTLRGEPYGQMTPEGQKLWDEYQNLLGTQKTAPMSNLKLRSGANFPIIEPGFGLRNRMLSKTLGGMTGTGMGTRAPAQPGLFAQLAPLFIAAGIKDPKTIMEMLKKFGIGGETETGAAGEAVDGVSSSDVGSDIDWGSLGGDFSSNFSPEDLEVTGGDWGWLD